MAEQGTGDLVVGVLQRAGVRNLFTLNGGHIWSILMAAEEMGVRLVSVRDEQTAAFAAEGWSKLTRECGACAVTAGPGVTNTISAIASAHGNDSPMLVIGGRSPLATAGLGSLQEMDHLPIVGSVTKYAHTATSPGDARDAVARALRLATHPRPGPVFVDVPADVFFGSAETEAAEPDLPAVAEADHEQVARAAKLIAGAERPCAVVGSGAWWAHAEDEVVAFLEESGMPAVLNGLARGMLPPGHPLLATQGRRVALGEADLVLVIGVPLDFRLGFGRPPVLDSDAKIVYVEFDDHRRHRPGEVELDGDMARSLRLLADSLRGLKRREDWLEKVGAAVAAAAAKDDELAHAEGAMIHPARLVHEVSLCLDEDAVVIGDGGDFVSFVGRMLQSRRPGRFLDPGPFGCLGTGAGYAMAARLAHPDRQVVLFSGDGAFGFSAMDFETLVREKLPVVAVIGNNGIWATEKHQMESMLDTAIATERG